MSSLQFSFCVHVLELVCYSVPVPCCILQPRLWDSIVAPNTLALLHYNSDTLFLSYFAEDGSTFKPPAGLSVNGADWAADHDMPESMRPILNDDRMEAFLLPVTDKNPDQEYFAFEVNKAGDAVVSRTRFIRKFDFRWQTAYAASNGSFAQQVGPCGSLLRN